MPATAPTTMSDDANRWVASHIAALPKSGIRDFFELVAKMKGQERRDKEAADE